MGRTGTCLGSLILLAACGGDPGPPCEGGGRTSATIGRDEAGGFVAYSDGDPIEVIASSTGDRLRLDYELTGLDTRSPVTAVVRLSLSGSASVDYLASVTLSCDDPGPAVYGAWADWPPAWGASADADGEDLAVDSVFTDTTGDVAEVSVDLVVDVAR